MKVPDNQIPDGSNSPAFARPTELYRVATRWHLYTGLIIGPFLITLAITGLIMMFSTVISGVNGELIHVGVESGRTPISLLEQEKNARMALPSGDVVEAIIGQEHQYANVFAVERSGVGTMMVAINPFTDEIIRTWWQGDRLYDFAKSIHSTLMLGTLGDLILETAAGFGVLLLISGCYLWWPRDRKLAACFKPRFKLRGRAFWRDLHQVIGVYSAAFILLFLLSGMSWTGVWGGKFVQAWNTFPADKWGMTSVDQKHHGSSVSEGLSPVPWTLEQTPAPTSASHHHSGHPKVLDIASVNQLGTEIGFKGRYRIKYPQSSEGVWTISQDTMNGDAENPFSDRTVHIDQYSGDLLADIQFSQYPVVGKVMAVSIPLHMGLMGYANIALNLLVCIAVLCLPAMGLYLWWRRASHYSANLLTQTGGVANKDLRVGKVLLWCLSLAFPLIGLALIFLWLIDFLIIRKIKSAREQRLRQFVN